MILVTGANGHLGSLTIDSLIKNNPNAEIAGLVRSQEKGKELKKKDVELRIGDYDDPSSIKKAVQGVDTLLLVSSSTLKGRIEQHKKVIDLPAPAFEKALREYGLSEEMVAISMMTASTFANGALSSTYGNLETLLGRRPTGFGTFVSEFIQEATQ
ncbi:MAG: NAD(P)H-binding protein [Balneolaceae bacterium]